MLNRNLHPETPMPARVLIVDDHPMMREGLRTLISREQDLTVCGEAETAGDALGAVANLRPDLVLADITLPGRSGVELIKDIHALQPSVLILVISMHDELLYAERVLRAGARGYIMKQESGSRMMEAIRQVLAGRIYLSDKMSARILENVVGRRPKASPIERLSDREFEVFQLIGRGKSTAQIAEELHLSTKTVEGLWNWEARKKKVSTMSPSNSVTISSSGTRCGGWTSCRIRNSTSWRLPASPRLIWS